MKTYSLTGLALLSIACATTSRTTPDPSSAGTWGILKDHSS